MIYGVTYNLSLIEKEIGRPSYSAQTIRNLLDEYKLDKINFIIGMDAFAQIDKWKSPEVLKKYCHFLVIPRDNINIDFDKLKLIPKKYYTWKGSDILQLGTIAQDIQKIYPEVVSKNENGYLSVDYSKLSIIALAAIDKLNERIKELECQIKL